MATKNLNELTADEMKELPITVQIGGRETVHKVGTQIHKHFLNAKLKEEREKFEENQIERIALVKAFVDNPDSAELFNNDSVEAIAIVLNHDTGDWDISIRAHSSMVRIVNKFVQKRRTREEIDAQEDSQ